MKTLRIQGNGTYSQAPDQIRVELTLAEVDADFCRAIDGCDERLEALKESAQTAGLSPEALKTVRFDVQEQSEYQSGRRIFIGFKSTHVVAIPLPMDRELVRKFLSAVIASDAEPAIKITFEISDAEAFKQKVLASAVENALRRARTIAEAAGVELGSIVNIDCRDDSETPISSQECMMDSPSDAMAGGVPDFNPEAIDASESVTVTWEFSLP